VPDIFPSSIKILIMENGNFIEKLASQFGQSASVKNVYGEPIQAGDKTIIPVAQIAYGLGGGYGQGNKRKRPNMSADNTNMALTEKEDWGMVRVAEEDYMPVPKAYMRLPPIVHGLFRPIAPVKFLWVWLLAFWLKHGCLKSKSIYYEKLWFSGSG